MQRYTVYLYLETALHVSGGFSTHIQEHTQLYLQHLVLVKLLMLPATMMEEMELQSSSNKMQPYTVLSVNCSTCFGWYLHPSSGAHTTVSTASGTCQSWNCLQFQLFHDSGM